MQLQSILGIHTFAFSKVHHDIIDVWQNSSLRTSPNWKPFVAEMLCGETQLLLQQEIGCDLVFMLPGVESFELAGMFFKQAHFPCQLCTEQVELCLLLAFSASEVF